MQGLRIFSRSGEALSSEEISAAHKIANTHKEMRFGVITAEDPISGVKVEFHPLKRFAFTQPGRIQFWYPCNAVAKIIYRTVNAMAFYTDGIPVVSPGTTWALDINVFTSDGVILAVQPGSLYYRPAPEFGSVNYNYIGNVPNWPGGGYYRYVEEFPAATYVENFVEFEVPQDIAMPPEESHFLSITYPLTVEDRAAANERLRNYILGFSDATLNKLSIGELEPHVKRAIKNDHPQLSPMAQMEELITGSSSDVVISENIEDLYAERTIERTVTLTYSDREGNPISVTVTGTLKLESVMTDALDGGGYYVDLKATYTNFPAFNELPATPFDRTGSTPSVNPAWIYPPPLLNYIGTGFHYRPKYLKPSYMAKHHQASLIETKTGYPLMAIINGTEQDNPSSLATAEGGTNTRYNSDEYSNIESEYLFSSVDGVLLPGGMRQVVKDEIAVSNHPFIISYREVYGPIYGGTDNTLAQVLAIFGFTSVEQLYAFYGASTEQEFLNVLGFYTMQAAINFLMENPGGDPSKLDCGLLDSELITIYPYEGIRRDNLNYGIYSGQYTGIHLTSNPVDVIRFSKGYMFRYSFATGEYTFVRVKNIVDKRLDPPAVVEQVEFDISDLPGPQKNEFLLRNMIVLSSRSPTLFAEADAAYRAQAQSIKDEDLFDEGALTLMGLYDFLS